MTPPTTSPPAFNPFADTATTDDGFVEVYLPSGAPLEVLNEAEAAYCQERCTAYTSQFRFENVSDLAILDQIIGFELIVHRLQKFVLRGTDFNGKKIDEKDLTDRAKSMSIEIRQLKKHLGIDKLQRDRSRGEGSLHLRWENLLQRAGTFGVMRDQQTAKAIELAFQAIALVDTHKNMNDDERTEFHMHTVDIVDWLDGIFRDEFNAIDAAYREGHQKMWVRNQ